MIRPIDPRDPRKQFGSRSLRFEMHPEMRSEVEKLARSNKLRLEEFMAAVFHDAVDRNRIISKEVAASANAYAPVSGKKAKVFICHASEDKPFARRIYNALKKRLVDPWLDEKNLFGGVDWDAAIQAAIRESDAIMVLLSQHSVSKQGYVQKEIKKALETAELMPEGRIYIIPVQLDDVSLPSKLAKWQAIDFKSRDFYDRILRSIQAAIEKADS